MSIENWIGWAMIALGAAGMFYSSSKAIGVKATIAVWAVCAAVVAFVFAAAWLITQ